MTAITDRSALRRPALVLGVAVLVSCAYFYQAGGWNQNTRFALVRALLEEHTVRIDTYREHTGDRAVWKGHVYSDKAPGASFLALAPSAVARAVARVSGVDPGSLRGVVWMSYVASVSTAGLFTAIAAVCVFWLTCRWGASRGAALFAATAYAVSGPAWAYGTVFIGHNVTGGCLMLAFAAAVALADAEPGRRAWLAWAVGLLCGLAVLTEFPAAVPVLIIVFFALRTIYIVDRSALLPLGARLIAGGAVMAALLMSYHAAAFDSPFRLGYGSEDNVEGAAMQQGLFGISHPTPHVVYEVLLGSYRGLLPISPLVILMPVGLILAAQISTRRLAIVTAAAVAGFYVLLNVSYTYWEGGWFFGPRHLVPGLPFLALGLWTVWDRWRGWLRVALLAGWVWGAAVNLVAVSTTVQPPSDIMAPVSELLWPAFREGDLSLNTQSIVDYLPSGEVRRDHAHHAAWNLGELVGLRGLVSLLPLLALWGLAALLLR